MSFPRYPTYKNSDSGWMFDVPEHWEILPCRGFVDERTEKNEDASCQSYLSLMANVGVIPYEEKGDIGNKKPDDLSKCKIVHQGDFVINSMNYGIGSYGVSSYEGVCSPVYIILRPKSEVVEPGFAFRVFEDKSFQAYAQSFGNGILAHRCSIGWDDLKGIAVGIPPAEEQKSILNFLEYETAKIDSLISEQERLIVLLQEKRQAVISHAVTKGLNPNAPMKNSGVEWLGKVPDNWKIIPLNYVLKAVGDVDHYMPESTDSGIPYIMTGDLKDFASNIDFDECKQVSEENYEQLSKKIKTQKGDLILARYATIGTVSYVDIDKRILVSYSCVTIKVNPEKVVALYLYFFIKAQAFTSGIKSKVNSNTQDNVGIGDLKKVLIALPKVNEQLEIVEYLKSATSQLSKQLKASQDAVRLLRERRAALISAAVTGQIDVRGLAPEEEVAA